MRTPLLAVTAVLAIAACLPPAATQGAAFDPDSAVAVSAQVVDVKNGLDALQKFIDIFNSKIFETTQVAIVAELLSKAVGFLISIIDLIRGAQSEDPLMRQLRLQFAEVNAKLSAISTQIEDVKILLEWYTTRQVYAQCELAIKDASGKFDAYVRATASEKETRRKLFVDNFKSKYNCAGKLYMAIVDTDFVIAQNLAAAAVSFTKNHRVKVVTFLLAMSRLILRGSQLEIAYHRLQNPTAASVVQRDWQANMKKYAVKMKAIEDSVKSKWYDQMNKDAGEIINNQRHLSNKDFSGYLYNFLAEKFDWQLWIVVAYNDVTGSDKHYYRAAGGIGLFRVAGNRNVVIGRTDPKTSKFSRTRAESALRTVDGDISRNAEYYNNKLHDILPVNGIDATLIGVFCYGCDMWFTANSRVVFRTLKCASSRPCVLQAHKERVHALIFG